MPSGRIMTGIVTKDKRTRAAVGARAIEERNGWNGAAGTGEP